MLGFLVLCAAAFAMTSASVDIGSCCCPNQLKYTVILEHLSWFQAYEACERRGLELASIYSQSEEDAVEFALGNHTNGVGKGFWTAATSLASPGANFAWFTTGSELSYKNFPAGQPDNPTLEKCVELFRMGDGKWKWNNFQCQIALPYICQTKPNCCYFN